MSAETEHNEHLDLFSLKIRQKLEDHRLPVNMEGWEQIEAKVAGHPRFSLWRIGGWVTVTAAVLALLLLIRLYPIVSVLDAGSQEEGLITEKMNPKKMDTEKLQPDRDSSFTILCQAEERVVAHVVQKRAAVLIPVDTIAWEEAIEEIELPPNVEVTHPAIKVPAVRHLGPEPEKHRTQKLFVRADKPKTKGGGWQIGANIGTGGHLSLDMGLDDTNQDDIGNDPMDPNVPLPPVPPATDDKPELDMGGGPASFSQADCAPPISFGITVRKALNNRIALESGLVYTYLYTKLNQSRMISGRATLGLHYLGIPVNLVINLWDNPDWNVYVSGGGMIEKGVRSIYHVEAYGLDEHKSATYRSGIDGLQWSLNLSVGVSYRFYRDWSLYLEPRYSYYFNNNQPVSYRTENMTLIGVGAGVRFEF